MGDEGIEIARPEHWGGYEIVVDGMEFWQGRPGRVHDRARYQKVEGAWVKTRLSP
jgi:pyridoxamine 5'-phosphate oxidase